MQVIKDIPGDIADCLAMSGSPDLGRVKAFIASQKLTNVAKNAALHSLNIIADINASKEDCGAGNYHKGGEDASDIIT